MAEQANAPKAPASAAPAPVSQPAAAAGPAPHYREGKLTRAGMEHAIRTGGSVTINGAVINTLDRLPTEVDLARGDDVAEAAALENINRQRAALDAQEASLKAPKRK
jgi:hypothetical protein